MNSSVFVGAVVALGCLAVAPDARAATASAGCPTIAGSDALLRAGAHILLGESHGTNEIPRFVADLACAAAKLGPLRVGLEIPVAEQARLDAFLASPGTAADREALHKDSAYWLDPFQDGRRSVAAVALLESLRQLRHSGADVRVIAYDAPGDDRDLAMAQALERAFKAEPRATFVMLAGNLHARKNSGRMKQTFMADYLVKAGAAVTTLDARFPVGTAWICLGDQPNDCGPSVWATGRYVSGTPRTITLGATKDGAYDGTFDVGAPTYAPPAFVALTPAQKARIALLPAQRDARIAYDDKQFARCAALHQSLAQRDGAHFTDHAYDAACCYALAGDAAAAFAQLSAALDHGPLDAASVAGDRDLQSLHADARWTALQTRLQAKPAAH